MKTTYFKEAIILAGGLGTRLHAIAPGVPKAMVPIAGAPFISYVINHLKKKGIERFFFSLGYKHEIITSYLNNNHPKLNKQYIIEDEPLGTGGAIKQAISKTKEETALIINGDTLFKADLNKLITFHHENKADCTLCLKPMHNFDRYGAVEADNNGIIKAFKEKEFCKEGLINGGIYALNAPSFLHQNLPAKFSFENDYLATATNRGLLLQGLLQDCYFIDIGIPEDLARAQKELSLPT